jgi:hypothetical protein
LGAVAPDLAKFLSDHQDLGNPELYDAVRGVLALYGYTLRLGMWRAGGVVRLGPWLADPIDENGPKP